jgi:cytochrome c551/c552
MMRPLPAACLLLALAGAALPLASLASMNLALEKGCLNCHGTPPRDKAPTMADLASRYAQIKGNEAEIARRSAHLREHHLFGGVPAHERLSAEEADRFVRWLVDGGR